MKELSIVFLVLGMICHSLRDRAIFYGFKNPFFRLNWQNRYNLDGSVKWWTWIFPFFIDGVHLLGDLMLLCFVLAVYFANPVMWGAWWGILLISWAVRQVEHIAIMQRRK